MEAIVYSVVFRDNLEELHYRARANAWILKHADQNCVLRGAGVLKGKG